MSETLIVKDPIDAESVKRALELGMFMSNKSRAVKEVDGPFTREGEQVWIIYTKDAPR